MIKENMCLTPSVIPYNILFYIACVIIWNSLDDTSVCVYKPHPPFLIRMWDSEEQELSESCSLFHSSSPDLYLA